MITTKSGLRFVLIANIENVETSRHWCKLVGVGLGPSAKTLSKMTDHTDSKTEKTFFGWYWNWSVK